MRLRVALALCGLSAALLFAQEEAKKEQPKKGPQLDEISKKLLTNWDKCTYHLGRAGVKKASCKVKVTASQMGQEMAVNLDYKWDGEKGKFDWDNAQMGAMLAQTGFEERFDGDFKSEPFEKQLGTAKCTAKAVETGGHVVTVEGKTKAGFKSFTFDKDGVLTCLTMEQAGRMGGMQTISMKLSYTTVDGKYLLTSQTGDVDGAMGKMSLDIKFTHAQVGGYHVKQKQVTTISMGGAPFATHTLEFRDWKLNEAVDGAKPAEPESKDESKGEDESEGEDAPK